MMGLLALLIWSTIFQACLGISQPRPFNWDAIKYVYAFGDSYSFVGGTEGHANFSFIGDAFNLAFTPKQLLSNEIIPKNTSSDGSNWLEFLTGCGQGRPSDCPRQLWDFSFAGADIDNALLPLHHNFSVDLVTQVGQWAAYAADVIPHPADESLTAWWIGINDTGDTLDNTTITDFHAFWEIEMISYFNAVQRTYDLGLQGAHLFINVPPEERAPGHINDPNNGLSFRDHITDFNSVLDTHVQRFAATNPEAHVLKFDAHSWFNTILDNFTEYGFQNITSFCTCKDPSFFWFDVGHPTEHAHELLAMAVRTTLQEASVSH